MDISTFKFVSGKGNGSTTACLFSARSLLDGRPFTDEHPSATLRTIGIRINDGPWWDSDEERTATLLPLALDERLCASKCVATPEVEQKRKEMCVHWARSWAAPFSLEQAALALEAKLPDDAKALREHAAKLRAEPTRENAIAARDMAHKAQRTADAAYAYAAAAAAAAAAAIARANLLANLAGAAAYADLAARISARKPVRDSLIGLFKQMLGACEGAENGDAK
jgi:hypothetical protein